MNSKFQYIGVLVFCIALFACPISSSKAQTLHSFVDVSTSGNVWSYTLYNLESSSSSSWITSFFLPINGPIRDVTAPADWTSDTDNISFVLWSNPDDFPYPHDIAPNGSLSGFSFTSDLSGKLVNVIVSSWDHDTDNPGANASLSVVSPLAVPEPEGWVFIAEALCLACLRRFYIKRDIHRRDRSQHER